MRIGIWPFMCAPSTTVITPLARAASQILRTGMMVPMPERMPEKNNTRVRGPMADIIASAN